MKFEIKNRIDLAKLKKLEAQASPAPWWQDDINAEDGHGSYKAYCVGYDTKAILDTSNSDVQLIEQDDGPRYDLTGHRDTEFVAEMRNATPALIARIEKLEAALKPFEGWIDRDDSDDRLVVQFNGLRLTVGDVRKVHEALK